MQKSKDIAGVWYTKAVRGETLDGTFQEETVFGGGGMFGPDGSIFIFIKTSEYTFGYVGTYTFDGEAMKIQVRASNNAKAEGHTHIRKVTFLADHQIKLSAVDEVTGLRYEIELSRTYLMQPV